MSLELNLPKLPGQFKAAVFDMDGLLIDSERICMQVFAETCAALGLPFLEQTYLGIVGCNASEGERRLRQGYGEDFDYASFRRQWLQRYQQVLTEQAIPLKPGVKELLEYLQHQGLLLAVATSTERSLALQKLAQSQLTEYFSEIVCGCQVEQSKPAPDIYQLAAKRLGVSSEACLAFEDSCNGVKAAIAAGMLTIQIPDLVAPDKELKKLGHLILPSLSEVQQAFQRAL